MTANRQLWHRLLQHAGVVAILFSIGFARSAQALPEIVHVDGGQVRGLADPAVLSFRGIPFAAPPIGRLRWSPPQAPQSWTGIRDATRYTPPCAQASAPNEDCLYLNVTVPRAPGVGAMPVMVWLHGGGLSGGAGSTYDPTRMAVQGHAVVVTIDFRLNVFGFFAYQGLQGSGDFGLQDQQAALAGR